MKAEDISCLEDACAQVCNIWESSACADDQVVGEHYTITRRETSMGGGMSLTITPHSPEAK